MQPLTSQVEVYADKERRMREIDALYDAITDPRGVRIRRILAGLEAYTRQRYALEFANPYSNQFTSDLEWQFKFCARDDGSYQVRMVRLMVLFTHLVIDGRVRAHFCEPGVTEHTLDPDKTLVDPEAFNTWIRDYMLAYTNDLFDGVRMDIGKYIQSGAAMYVSLLRNSPEAHPRAVRRRRQKVTTSRP